MAQITVPRLLKFLEVPQKEFEQSRMTRFLAAQLATSHYFDISRARQDFNYQPVVSPEEGMLRLLKFLEVPQKE